MGRRRIKQANHVILNINALIITPLYRYKSKSTVSLQKLLKS